MKCIEVEKEEEEEEEGEGASLIFPASLDGGLMIF